MIISINNTDATCEMAYDICGNVFVLYNNECYWVNINNINELALEKIENITSLMKIKEFNDKYKKIKHTFNPYSLKGKILSELLEEKDPESDCEDEDDDNYIKNLNYHPEDKYYYTENEHDNNDNEEIDDHDMFDIAKFDDSKVKLLDRTFNSLSLYDTFFIDNKNDVNMVIFTLESKEKSSYRITIKTDSTFTLNIVGERMNKYILEIKESVLLFMKI